MRNVFNKGLLVITLSVLPLSAYAMGKKPDKDEKSTPAPVPAKMPESSKVTPVEDIQKPSNPTLPAATGTSGTTGMNGTGMGSGTSH